LPHGYKPQAGFDMFLFYFISRSAKKKAPFYFFFSPQKAKNNDKVTFLERISQKYLVTFGNFCTFAAHLANDRRGFIGFVSY